MRKRRGIGCVTMKADTGVTWSQVKECQQPLEAGDRTDPSLDSLEGVWPW